MNPLDICVYSINRFDRSSPISTTRNLIPSSLDEEGPQANYRQAAGFGTRIWGSRIIVVADMRSREAEYLCVRSVSGEPEFTVPQDHSGTPPQERLKITSLDNVNHERDSGEAPIENAMTAPEEPAALKWVSKSSTILLQLARDVSLK